MDVKKVNMTGINMSEFNSRNINLSRTGHRVKKDNRISTGMSSITGINVMAPLRPNSRISMNRSNVYSLKENYKRGRKLKDHSQSNIESRQNKVNELSSQEQCEKIWGRKMIEKMRLNDKDDQEWDISS